MKHIKKSLSILVTILVVIFLTIPVFAATATLFSAGRVGTALFYVIGFILIINSVVSFVIRKTKTVKK